MRHQSFQRQLSHRLDLPIKFSIYSLDKRSDSNLGLIKVRLETQKFLYISFYKQIFKKKISKK